MEKSIIDRFNEALDENGVTKEVIPCPSCGNNTHHEVKVVPNSVRIKCMSCGYAIETASYTANVTTSKKREMWDPTLKQRIMRI